MKKLILILMLTSSTLFADSSFREFLLKESGLSSSDPRCRVAHLGPGVDAGINMSNQLGSAFYAGGIIGMRNECGAISGVFYDVLAGDAGTGSVAGFIYKSTIKFKRTQFKADAIQDPLVKHYDSSVAYTVGIHLFYIGFDVGTMITDTPNGERTVPLVAINIGF